MKDVFSTEDIVRAESILERSNIPVFEGHYYVFVTPDRAEDIKLWSWETSATYRDRITAWALLEYERKRQRLGRRGFVFADEVICKIQALALASREQKALQ